MKTINLDQLRRIRDGSGHSVYGPSGAPMWLNCPGSLIPNLLAPDTAGIDAAYGTVGHHVTETWLSEGQRPTHLVGTNMFVEAGDWGYLIWIDDEMLSYAEECVQWVSLIPGKRYVERRVDISRITPIPNQTGTADLIIIDGRRMYSVDWKFGKGHQVFAERNPQLMLYALGALWEFDPDGDIREIVIRIGQPRLDHFDEWVTTRDELMQFAGYARERMALAWQPDAPRVPGAKQCQFCRVKASCAAYAKMEIDLMEGAFEDLDAPVTVDQMVAFKGRVDDTLMEFSIDAIEAGTLSTEQLCRLRPFRSVAEKWWKSIDTELMHRAQRGEDLESLGHKIVEARSRRVFKAPMDAVERLSELGVPRDSLIENKVVSPAAAEKLLRKIGYRGKELPNLLEDLTRKPPGKPTIVPLSDKRPTIVDLSGIAFDDLDSEDPEDGEL